MIELTAVTGGRVAVNPILVFAIEATDGGTQIVSAAGGVVVVSEAFEEGFIPLTHPAMRFAA